MKLRAALPLSLLAVTSIVHADPCGDRVTDLIHQEDAQEQELVLQNHLADTDRAVNFLRNFTGQADTAATLKNGLLVADLDNFLRNGHTTAAANLIKTIFRDFESAYWGILRDDQELAGLQEELARAKAEDKGRIAVRVDRVKERIKKNEAIFGRNYSQYMSSRHHLEDIIDGHLGNCTQACATGSETILQRVALSPSARRVYSVATTEARPSLAELQKFYADEFNHHPRLRLEKLQRDLNLEIGSLIKIATLQPSLLKSAQVFVTRVPGINKSEVVRLFGLFYDEYGSTVHFPKITSVLRAPGGVEEQVRALKAYAASDPDLLITFARRVDADKQWKQFREFAQSTGDERFLAEMKDADDHARVMGNISPVYRRSDLQKITILLTSAAAIDYSLNEEHRKKLHQLVQHLLFPQPQATDAPKKPAQ